MGRTDLASRVVPATPERIYRALTDPGALISWLPPGGMTGRLDSFDARVGGGYRMTLTYREAPQGGAKTTADSDVVDVRFAALAPPTRLVQEVDFTSEDPSFAGTMTMTWSMTPVPGGSKVTIRCDDVPPGISPEDHRTGLTESLSNLAAHLRSEG
jgi:uncharacterized protein YndB with AHSA1/START domain